MWNIFFSVYSGGSEKRQHCANGVLKGRALVFLISLLLTTPAQAQSITSDELLLDPRDLPTYERQINLVWKPIRDKISTLGGSQYAGRPQAALVNIYVENNSWQLAWEYAQNISVPVWRANALLLISNNQRADGISSLANRMLNSALFLLRPVSDDNTAPEVFAQAAKSIFETGDFKLLKEFFDLVEGRENILAMAREIYPLLEEERYSIVLDALARLTLRYEEQYDEESFRFFLDLAKLGEDLGVDEVHRGSISHAYNVSLGRARTDELRDVQLEELARNLVFTGQHRLALQVISQISDRIIQSRLYATAGRVRAQIRKRPEVGSPLLNLANDSLLLLDSDIGNNNDRSIDKEALNQQIEHARSWAMIEKVQANLVDEAIRDAERIDDKYKRQRALALIALVLADSKDYNPIKELVAKVDYANLRLSLYLGLIGSLSEPNDVTNLLVESLASENFYEKDSGYAPLGLSEVLSQQIEKGNQNRNDEVFGLVQERIIRFLNGFDEIIAQVEYFYYFARRSRLKASYTDTEITSILSSLWPYTKHPQYGYLMSRIMRFYLENGKPEQAFNVAITLSDDLNDIKLEILKDIATYASTEGDEALTLRVVNQIADLDDQIDVLTGSINNLAKSREIQRF